MEPARAVKADQAEDKAPAVRKTSQQCPTVAAWTEAAAAMAEGDKVAVERVADAG
jgi:hypothetical protein